MTVLWVLIGLLVGAAGAVLAYRPVLRRFSLERETWRQEAVQREEQVGTLRDQLSGQAVQLTEAAVRYPGGETRGARRGACTPERGVDGPAGAAARGVQESRRRDTRGEE